MMPKEEIWSSHDFRVHLTQHQEPVNWASVNFDPDDVRSYTELKGELLEILKRCQAESFSKEIGGIERKGRGEKNVHIAGIITMCWRRRPVESRQPCQTDSVAKRKPSTCHFTSQASIDNPAY
jgi:hypothetical protein